MSFKNKQFLFYLLFICFVCLNIKAQESKSNIQIPNINYCDLIREPLKYDKKVFRIKAVYIVGFEGSVMTDNHCEEANAATWVEFAPDIEKSTDAKIWEKFETLTNTTPIVTKSKFDFPIRRIEVIWIGLFEANGAYGHMNAFDYQFTIQKIEEVIQTKPQNKK